MDKAKIIKELSPEYEADKQTENVEFQKAFALAEVYY